jgi:hypothetical protein
MQPATAPVTEFFNSTPCSNKQTKKDWHQKAPILYVQPDIFAKTLTVKTVPTAMQPH